MRDSSQNKIKQTVLFADALWGFGVFFFFKKKGNREPRLGLMNCVKLGEALIHDAGENTDYLLYSAGEQLAPFTIREYPLFFWGAGVKEETENRERRRPINNGPRHENRPVVVW